MMDIALTAPLVKGAAELETLADGIRLHRLPLPYREREADSQLRLVEAQPAGVRLAFRTRATTVSLKLRATRVVYTNFTRERGAVDITVSGEPRASHQLVHGDALEIDMATGAHSTRGGDCDLVHLDNLAPQDKLIEIWLPHNEQVDLLGLSSDAPLDPVDDTRPVWLHHGSSISQGSNAATPLQTWPAVAARLADVQLHNLGFGGSAVVDPFMARVMRDLHADMISVKLGINVVNLDAMRARSFVPAVHGFLDTIREGHPETPLVLVSPLHCGIHETTPGPGSIDPAGLETGSLRFVAVGDPADTQNGKLALEPIRALLTQVIADRANDPNLHFLNGLDLYGPGDTGAHPLPDGLHPDAQTHRLIGQRFAETAFGTDGLLRMAASTR